MPRVYHSATATPVDRLVTSLEMMRVALEAMGVRHKIAIQMADDRDLAAVATAFASQTVATFDTGGPSTTMTVRGIVFTTRAGA